MNLINQIAASVEAQSPNAFYLNSTGGKVNLLIEGRQHPGVVCVACLKAGDSIVFSECTSSTDARSTSPSKPFTLIASKRKKSSPDFVLFDSTGKILISTDETPTEPITGYIWIGFRESENSYSILLTINITSDCDNFCEMIVDGDDAHCSVAAALCLFAYKGDIDRYEE